MRRELTTRQQEVLATIRQEVVRCGVAPSVRELGQLLGSTSTNNIAGLLKELERKGYIRRLPGKARAIVLVDAPPGTVGATATRLRSAIRDALAALRAGSAEAAVALLEQTLNE